MERLHPNMRRLKAVLLIRLTKGVGKTFCKPAAQLACQRDVLHDMGRRPTSRLLQVGPGGSMVHENLRKT